MNPMQRPAGAAAMMRMIESPALAVLSLSLLGVSCATPAYPQSVGGNGGPSPAELPCPNSPNCVSSRVPLSDPHYIEALAFTGDPAAAMVRLAALVGGLPRIKVIDQGPAYLRTEFRSAFLRFVDDVDFSLSPDESVIHVRSASRVGYSDFGVNRKRIEDIRRSFAVGLAD